MGGSGIQTYPLTFCDQLDRRGRLRPGTSRSRTSLRSRPAAPDGPDAKARDAVHIVFAGEKPPRVISADTLFKGSIGRTDLPGGDYETIMRTLRDRFLPLPDDMVVYPGHGPETTMGEEKLTNPFLSPLTRSGG